MDSFGRVCGQADERPRPPTSCFFNTNARRYLPLFRVEDRYYISWNNYHLLFVGTSSPSLFRARHIAPCRQIPPVVRARGVSGGRQRDTRYRGSGPSLFFQHLLPSACSRSWDGLSRAPRLADDVGTAAWERLHRPPKILISSRNPSIRLKDCGVGSGGNRHRYICNGVENRKVFMFQLLRGPKPPRQ